MCKTIFTRHSCKHLSTQLTRCLPNLTTPLLSPRDCPSPQGHRITTLRSFNSCGRCQGIKQTTPLLGCDRERMDGGLEVKIRCLGCEFLGKRCGDEWWVADFEECLGEDVVVEVKTSLKTAVGDKKLDSVSSGLSEVTKGSEMVERRESAAVFANVRAIVVWDKIDWSAGGSMDGRNEIALDSILSSVTEEEKTILPRMTTFKDWMKWGQA